MKLAYSQLYINSTFNIRIFWHFFSNIKVKSVHGIKNFLNCDGAGSISDNSPPKGSGLVGLLAGGPAIGSLGESNQSLPDEP